MRNIFSSWAPTSARCHVERLRDDDEVPKFSAEFILPRATPDEPVGRQYAHVKLNRFSRYVGIGILMLFVVIVFAAVLFIQQEKFRLQNEQRDQSINANGEWIKKLKAMLSRGDGGDPRQQQQQERPTLANATARKIGSKTAAARKPVKPLSAVFKFAIDSILNPSTLQMSHLFGRDPQTVVIEGIPVTAGITAVEHGEVLVAFLYGCNRLSGESITLPANGTFTISLLRKDDSAQLSWRRNLGDMDSCQAEREGMPDIELLDYSVSELRRLTVVNDNEIRFEIQLAC